MTRSARATWGGYARPAVIGLAAVAGFAGTAVVFRPPTPADAPPAGAEVAPAPAGWPAELRAAAKDAIARDVLAGRTPLPEAAAMFAWMNAMPPALDVRPPNVLPPGVPVDPDELTVATWAAAQVAIRAAHAADEDGPPDRAGAARRAVWERFRADRAAGRLDALPAADPGRLSAVRAEAVAALARQQAGAVDGRGEAVRLRC